MKSPGTKLSRSIEAILPWAVLVIILLYTYVKFFAYPYAGFRWDNNGLVAFIFTDGNNVTPLRIGDRLIQADSVKWTDYKEDLRKPFIDFPHPGQVIQLRVERAGQELTLPWVTPGPNSGEIIDLLITSGWLGFIFWVLGTLTYFRLRPKNERWRLLVAFNYLTAVLLTAGSGPSILHVWESAIVLRVFVWMCMPVYLHLHWILPKPLGRLSPTVVWGGYLLTALLVVAQFFQLLPQSLYYLGFIVSILGSLLLLVLHAIRQPDSRNEIRALILVAILTFAPILVIGWLGTVITLAAGVTALGVISLPLLPLAYFYAALRRQFGGVELRFNRFFSDYVFTILLFTVLLPLLVFLDIWVRGPGSAILIGILILMIAVLATILGYRPAQRFFDRNILGISLPPQNLLELYSERITSSTSFSSLNQILEAEILPHLHIQQFAFIQIDKGSVRVLQALGVEVGELSIQNLLALQGPLAGKYRPVEMVEPNDPFGWVRLPLELKIAGEQVGLWLFGQRDPEDFYSQREIVLLQTLANQTAIALSNLLQTQRVLEMYQQDISRHEQERGRLALDLHDSILNQLAAMLLSMDDRSITSEFQAAYDELTSRLREIVSDLRPAMLNYGLKPALDELVESLAERDKNGLQVSLELQPDQNRYPAQVEQHLFRIVQEASENALRHGQAQKISLTGALLPDEITLTIADNGSGFESGQGFELADLLANKHFGLAGMLERARLIGGDLKIDSHPGAGTQVVFRWAPAKI